MWLMIMERLRLKKIRIKAKCWKCKKIIPKGSWAGGEASRWAKICINCIKNDTYPQWLERLKRLKKKTLIKQKELNKNWEKYKRDNTLAQLQDE